MNDDQKRAWEDAENDYIYEEAAKRLKFRQVIWRLFWAAMFLRVVAEFVDDIFSVEVWDD